MEQNWDAIWEECLKFKIQQKKEEFIELLQIMERRNCKSVLEIGCNTGGTARGFVEICDRVRSIDIIKFPEVEELEKTFSGFKFIQGDSTELTFVGEVDCLYIDGEHTEEYCRKDFNNFKRLVKPGGIIAFHDIAQSELHQMQNCEVWKVWENVKKIYPEHIESLHGDTRWGGMGIALVDYK